MARGHFHAVDAEIAAWLNENTHKIVYERNEDFTQHYLRAEFGSKPRFDRWPLLIGDCVTNLRDTLDHLIYGIANLPGSVRPGKAHSAAFVIAKSPVIFNEARGKLLSLPDAVRDAVLHFQPFNRPHAVLPPLLSILSELANGTKHKVLNVTLTVPQNLDIEFVSHRQANSTPSKPGIFAIDKKGILEGNPFLVFETPSPDPDCQLKRFRADFGIAIAHSPLPGDTNFDAGHTAYRILLQELFEEVELILNT